MTDTVQKLMGLAKSWADQEGNMADPLNSHEDWEFCFNQAKLAKQALHDELVRLFTPLSDEQIDNLWHSTFRYETNSIQTLFRLVEKAHGIGGEL